MDPVSSIPVPRVPSPRVSAPISARKPPGIAPTNPNGTAGEGFVSEALDFLPRLFPGRADELLFSATKLINKVIFRPKTEPGEPKPLEPGAWTWTAIGDYGSGNHALRDVTTNIARGNPELVVTLGDNVYYDGTEAEYARKWDPPKAFGDIRQNFPVLPSLGNHDTRVDTTPYFRRFPELKDARYYSYDKRDVHFVSVNTNESLAPGTPQANWLEKDLASTDKKFKVVYLHHPLYSAYPIGGKNELRGYLGPMLAKHGVELVLSGHEHNYSRMKPFNDKGTIEVISGGGGHTLHPFLVPQREDVAWRDVDFGHLEFEVRDEEMVGRYVVRDGSVRDTFVVPDIPDDTTADE